MGFLDINENQMNLMILIKLLISYNKDSDYLIDYAKVFDDLLHGAQMLHLQRLILANSFSLRHMTKASTEGALSCDFVNNYLHQVLLQKVIEDSNEWQKFFETTEKGATIEVSQLLRFITAEKLQLTKLEIKMVTKKLQDPLVAN